MISGDYTIDQCRQMLEAMNFDKISLPSKGISDELMAKYGEEPDFVFYKSGSILCRYELHRTIDYAKIELNDFWKRKISIVCSYVYGEYIRRMSERSKIPKFIKIYSKFYGLNLLPAKVIC